MSAPSPALSCPPLGINLGQVGAEAGGPLPGGDLPPTNPQPGAVVAGSFGFLIGSAGGHPARRRLEPPGLPHQHEKAAPAPSPFKPPPGGGQGRSPAGQGHAGQRRGQPSGRGPEQAQGRGGPGAAPAPAQEALQPPRQAPLQLPGHDRPGHRRRPGEEAEARPGQRPLRDPRGTPAVQPRPCPAGFGACPRPKGPGLA